MLEAKLHNAIAYLESIELKYRAKKSVLLIAKITTRSGFMMI